MHCNGKILTCKKILINLPRAFQNQLEQGSMQQQMSDLGNALDELHLQFQENTLNFVFVRGEYSDFEKKMLTSCVLINKTKKPVTEIHGEIRLKFRNKNAEIAVCVINFMEPFFGKLSSR